MSVRRYLRKHVYKWHRVTSLLVTVPILMWTMSGFLHPIMNAKKPAVTNQSPAPAEIDLSAVEISLKDALLLNGITSIQNFRIIKLGNRQYYQLKQLDTPQLLYIDCVNGTILPQGDLLYASWLAKRMMNEQPVNNGIHSHGDHSRHDDIKFASSIEPYAVTSMIYSRSVEMVTEFNKEYKSNQKLLPVYKITFERSDNIRLYIDTRSDKLAVAIDDRKAAFDRFFGLAHSWSFLNGMGKIKGIVLGCFSALCFFTSVFGFYVYNISKRKKIRGTGTATWTRKLHRVFGNIFLITTLLYAFSGSWHAFKKVPGKSHSITLTDNTVFEANHLDIDTTLLKRQLKEGERLTGLSIARIDGENYWQVSYSAKKNTIKKYIHTTTYTELPDGDMEYACWLACQFSGKKDSMVTESKCVSSFNHEYSMMNKRLPVVQVSFEEDDNYFIETGTGTLAACTGLSDKAERFSFSNLHMHHYPEMWWGKESGRKVRNIILISTTLGLLLLALTGILILLMKRYKQNRKPRDQ
jgi:hypothetical protein